MTTAVLTRRLEGNQMATAALRAAAQFWFVVAVIGQWAFLYYILGFYGRTTFSGHFEEWTKNVFLRKGYVAGDTTGNVAFAAHALLAAVIAFGGAIQLMPQVRARAISLHRWTGRVFFVTAFGLSVSGLYVLWFHGNPPDPVHGIAISLNAVLIILCIALAWRSAVRRDVAVHRRWALRAYLVANAQWFTRIGIMVWLMTSRKVLGVGGTYDVPFFVFIDFGCYGVPLVILELYLFAHCKASSSGKLAMAGLLMVITLLMGIGILSFYAFTRPLLEAVK